MSASATSTALAQVLGRRVDQLTGAIRNAIRAVESEGEPLIQYIADSLRAHLEEWETGSRVVTEDALWEDPDVVRAKVFAYVQSGRLDYTIRERVSDGCWQFLPGVVTRPKEQP